MTTPPFDENKHRRDNSGRFAEKGPSAEADDVELASTSLYDSDDVGYDEHDDINLSGDPHTLMRDMGLEPGQRRTFGRDKHEDEDLGDITVGRDDEGHYYAEVEQVVDMSKVTGLDVTGRADDINAFARYRYRVPATIDPDNPNLARMKFSAPLDDDDANTDVITELNRNTEARYVSIDQYDYGSGDSVLGREARDFFKRADDQRAEGVPVRGGMEALELRPGDSRTIDDHGDPAIDGGVTISRTAQGSYFASASKSVRLDAGDIAGRPGDVRMFVNAHYGTQVRMDEQDPQTVHARFHAPMKARESIEDATSALHRTDMDQFSADAGDGQLSSKIAGYMREVDGYTDRQVHGHVSEMGSYALNDIGGTGDPYRAYPRSLTEGSIATTQASRHVRDELIRRGADVAAARLLAPKIARAAAVSEWYSEGGTRNMVLADSHSMRDDPSASEAWRNTSELVVVGPDDFREHDVEPERTADGGFEYVDQDGVDHDAWAQANAQEWYSRSLDLTAQALGHDRR